MRRARRFRGLRGLVACTVVLATPALAQPSEVQNARMDKGGSPDNPECIIWDIQDSCGYHVYRGDLANLPGDYGACLIGTVQGNRAEVPDDPVPGQVFFYILTGIDEASEGTAGMDTALNERFTTTVCVPSRRHFVATLNGDPGDGIVDGRYPLRNSSLLTRASQRHVSGVYLHSGEMTFVAADIEIPGRGLDWTLMRAYRSKVDYNGVFGHNWDSNINARLAGSGVDVVYFDGSGRQETFFRVQFTGFFDSPAGRYAELVENADGSFTLRDPDGTLWEFHAFDGSNVQGALKAIQDRNGNRIAYLYDHQGLLVMAVDTLGRTIDFAYDATGRLTQVTDFSNRAWKYAYDVEGDLVSSRTPTVTGTPGGNDYPSGKTAGYAYSNGFIDARLNHDLLAVTSPNEYPGGAPALQVAYFDNLAPVLDQGRVQFWTLGGTNGSGIPAGGTLMFAYQSLNVGGDPNDLALPRRRATVFDRNGNRTEYEHNHPGNRISRIEFTNREVKPGEPDYTTEWDYNADGEAVEVRLPEGNKTQFVYDTPGLDRYREGNLLEVRRVADTLASGGRGNGHGGEATDIVLSYAYEPVYNRLSSVIEPRGNDSAYVPQNGGAQSATRYTTTHSFDYEEGDVTANGVAALAARFVIDLSSVRSNLGDRNGDGRTDQAAGNLIRKDAPGVTLVSGSNQRGIEGDGSQEIVTRSHWNDLGQLIARIDAEANRHELDYFPETDPDGDGTSTLSPPDGRALDGTTGGYLETRLTDTISNPDRDNKTNPTPAAIREDFRYDEVGNLTHHVDGRGVLSRKVFNDLNQVVELRRAAATENSAGPDGDAVTGRGETGLTAFGFKIRTEFDANDNVTARRVEDRNLDRSVGSYVDTTYTYDILDCVVERSREATALDNLVAQYRYDANENLTETIQPVGNSHRFAYDELDRIRSTTRGATGPRGGTASTRTHHYDGNRNETRIDDARGNRVDYEHDGFDRRARSVDQVGNTVDRFYDPTSNAVRTLVRGPIGGPTPSNRSGATNVDLTDVEYRYDELSRLIRSDRELFVPAGATPGRTPILVEGPLVAADGFINQRIEYDRLSRTTFLVHDSGATGSAGYDGAGRTISTIDPDGSTRAWFYDDADNLIERAQTELSSTPAVASELFLTTYFHDALGRMTSEVDNAGQTWGHLYDSLDAVVTQTDPNGPAGPTINRRSPPHGMTSVPTNQHGNVTRRIRDGAGRLLATERILTATRLGNGTPSPVPDTTNATNPDGILRVDYQWDDNSLLGAVVDDRTNTTSYAYDNLNRLVSRMMDDGTLHARVYDAEDNPTQTSDANGSVLSYIFDNANRLTQTDILRAVGVEGATQRTYEFDGRSLPTRALHNNDPLDSSDDAVLDWVYDSLGRVVEEKQTLSSAGGTKLVDLGWEAGSRITDLIYPSGRQIQYGYDLADRIGTVGDTARSETAAFAWFGMDRMHTLNYGNGVRATMLDDAGTSDVGYDSVKRVVRLRHLSATNTLLAGFEHSYDRASNPLHELRLHDEDVAAGGTAGELWSYDSANRLIGFEEGKLDPMTLSLMGSPTDSQDWTLDGVGNWTTMSRAGVDFNFTPNNLNEYDEQQSGGTRVDDGTPDDVYDDQATSVPDGLNHAHDSNGNLTGEGHFTMVFDAFDRPVRVVRSADGAPIATYKYDALGRRVWREVTNSADLDDTRRYLFMPDRPIAGTDVDAGGAPMSLKCICSWSPYPCGNKVCLKKICGGDCGGGGWGTEILSMDLSGFRP
jgi:YD repeat-containing protein